MSGRMRSERGAAAVEAALVTPIILFILVGIIEMSLLMRDTVSVTSSVRTGARLSSSAAGAGPGVCTASGPTPPPCTPASAPALAQAAADAIQRAGSAMPKDSIQWVLVYQANPAGYPLPTGNTNVVCSSNCVKYVWDAGLDQFRYASGSWTSSSINACVNDPLRQSFGVAMRARHSWITGLFGSGIDLQERSVMQFEPLPTDSCASGKHP